MGWFTRMLRSFDRQDGGQALALFAIGAVATFGAVGMAVDAGRMVGTRAEMQKAADASALAGSQDLPLTEVAISKAKEYLYKNASSDTGYQISVRSDKSPNDTVIVVASKRVDYTFLRVLGMSGTTVSAKAFVSRGYYSGGTGVLPFGFIASNVPTSTLLQNPCYLGSDDGLPRFRQNASCTLKFGAGTSGGGDFGALALDGTGAQRYEDAIMYGSSKPVRVNQLVNPQTGDLIGPTRQAIRDRLARPAPAGCAGNNRADVLMTSAAGTTTVKPGCESSARIIVIPIVDRIQNPENSKVLGFAILFLAGESMSGGQMQIQGEFITLVSPLAGGEYQNPRATGSSMATLTDTCSVCN